ncbi:MAG: electron transfer flavoprotein subunit beta/FixA family protein [Planctomycetes bacterium]|nr:electron transfer flavoprotein subunit beta/FixA family protein [Planctomycetota bacterium]
MRIIVLAKQVPETTEVTVDPETGTLRREGVPAIVNPFDTYAIEEGVRIKERLGGEVTVVSMGPPQAEAVLREAISVGADKGVLVTDRAFAGSDTWATSCVLAAACRTLGFDIIIAGKQAIDGDTAQVGPGVAMHLGIPQVTYVRRIDQIDGEHAVVERLLEDGYEVVETPIPALFTVVKEVNEPRLPSLRGKMAARKAEIRRLTADDIGVDSKRVGLEGSPTRVMKVFSPPKRSGGEKWEGLEPSEAAQKLVCTLRDSQVI